jgi:hypothetical protein
VLHPSLRAVPVCQVYLLILCISSNGLTTPLFSILSKSLPDNNCHMLRACYRMMGCPMCVWGYTRNAQDVHPRDVYDCTSLVKSLNPHPPKYQGLKRQGFQLCPRYVGCQSILDVHGYVLPGPQSVYFAPRPWTSCPVIMGDPLEITVRVREFHRAAPSFYSRPPLRSQGEEGGKIVCVKGPGLGMNKAVTLEVYWTFP